MPNSLQQNRRIFTSLQAQRPQYRSLQNRRKPRTTQQFQSPIGPQRPSASNPSPRQQFTQSIGPAAPSGNVSATAPREAFVRSTAQNTPAQTFPTQSRAITNQRPAVAIPQPIAGSMIPATVRPRASFLESDAVRNFLASTAKSQEERDLEQRIANISQGARLGIQEAGEQTIPMRFITGQQRDIENRATNQRIPLEQALTRLSGERQANTERERFLLNLAQQEQARNAPETFSVGGNLVRVDPATGQATTIFSAPQEATVGEERSGISEGISTVATDWARLVQSGQAKLTDVPSNVRSQVASAMGALPTVQTENQKRNEQRASQAIESIQLARQVFEAGGTADNPFQRALVTRTGVLGDILGAGGGATNLEQALMPLNAIIAFEELEQMRKASPTGGALGQVSNKEIDFLKSVRGSIDLLQGNEQLFNQLSRIEQSFRRIRAINDPTITAEEYLQQFPDATDQELAEIIQRNELSFNSVAGDTQQARGNRPQRNNNPGNVKRGGLADSLAVGTDEQGHLIFPSAEVGFQALRQDLQAKIGGRSQHVGANPTIAELGKVYAEDPNWSNKVAQILGVSTNTRTGSIDFEQLVQAIARQEGFYA